MRVQRREERRAHAVDVVLNVGDVSARARVAVLLREPEVDHVHHARVRACAHDEVRGLNVAVDEVLLVDVFDPGELGTGGR